MAIITKQEPASEVIAHDVEPLTVNTDARAASRIGWLIVVLGMGGFVLWASLAPLDKGVPLQGYVAKEGNRKAVQTQGGGTIQDILVHDGDVVKAGQLLVRLNSVQASAQVETSRAQYFAARSSEARLLAERDGLAKVAFPPALEADRNDPRVQTNYALQQQLFTSRRASLQSQLSAMDENIAGLNQQLKGLQESRDSKKTQLAILKEQLDNMRSLATDGYIARNRMLDLDRTYVQISGAMSEDVGNIGRARSQVLELQMKRSQALSDYQKEVRTQLADTQREAEALMSRISGQNFDVANTELKSPVDGVVVGQNVFTKGGVVGAGAKLMEIVPSDDAMVVEGQLAVNLVDKVHVGLPVELIFSAFNTNRTPHIPGTIIQVSADRTVDEKTGAAFYKVRAKVDKDGAQLIAAKKLQIQSGMPVEMFVKTGERTMMSYLLKPVIDRSHSSMSED
ncbi:membrane fusion protein, protease secretion system [Duganella sp. CF517]|uniref:HlyD family type I secretion periplasmic adaptor subunit n=1 Tax=Duganella sp. CF517 TaxID=1881038 RepID=UPI0008D6618D|nr:HlyD family type I secretion periplasmic adaptor subunit [Duganella sp. CF517]SEO20987.1 membrane fusion protein, protease secretion system [Duganella sp. CF517]